MRRLSLAFCLLVACSSSDSETVDGGDCDAGVCGVTRIEPADPVTLPGCTYASPIRYAGDHGTEILLATSERLSALSTGGELLWNIALPAPEGEMAFVVATPALVGDRLVVSYHTVERTTEPHDVGRERKRHMVAVVDLKARAIDDAFEPVELDADFEGNDGATVPFTATNALGRALTHVATGSGLGLVYATFGNARDIQPWHGFIFELDLDAWLADGASAAISASFISTPEADCGEPGVSGSRDRVCGGGMWSPSGPLVVERANGPELFVSTGNGQLDLARSDFANTVLRLRPGLQFDPNCDASACEDFDLDAPDDACVESCRDLFIPRAAPGDAFPMPESGACDGLTMFECWGKLDYDFGGGTAADVKLESGLELLAYAAKDGALYLFDADHLGTLYDRKQLVSICGTESDACQLDWAGMVVTQPAVSEADGKPLILVPTFMPDSSHPAGVIAVTVNDGGDTPELEVRWQAPSFDTPAARTRFRRHPSRIRLSNDGQVAWLVEAAPRGGRGRLLALRVDDGAILVDQELAGPGYRFTLPLAIDDRVFVPSCQPDNGPSALEIYEVSAGSNR